MMIKYAILVGVALLSKIITSLIVYKVWKQYKLLTATKKGYQMIPICVDDLDNHESSESTTLYKKFKATSNNM